jgi:hypothetical protein
MPHKVKDDESYAGLDPNGPQHNPDNVLIYYSAQLFLRRRLDRVHQGLYGEALLCQPLEFVQDELQGHEDILQAWRMALPEMLKWEDDDPAPADILAARLRAKYWGARYIINRPFLDYALHVMPHIRGGRSVEAAAVDRHGNIRDEADVHLFKAIRLFGDDRILEAARRCVDAAMYSTVAFDNVPGRIIVTNIHGTAHA